MSSSVRVGLLKGCSGQACRYDAAEVGALMDVFVWAGQGVGNPSVKFGELASVQFPPAVGG